MGNLCCSVEVPKSTVAIQEKFGRHHKNLYVGRHCSPWICGYEVVGELSLRIQQLDDVKCSSKTKDNENVDVIASVRYKVDRVYEAFYTYDNPRELIRDCTKHAIGCYIERCNLDELSDLEQISACVIQRVKELLDDSGYAIVEAVIVDIKWDTLLENPMMEINAGRHRK